MAKKFSKMAADYNVNLGALFNRAIRQALLAGLAMAVSSTKQDSSNAAAHWIIAAKSISQGGRKWRQLRDLRETSVRPRTEPVGRRRDGGKNAALTLRFVRDRELRDVIEKLVAGRRPATQFYFYNAVDLASEYGANAHIEHAAEQAIQETQRVFQNRIAAGQARKNPL